MDLSKKKDCCSEYQPIVTISFVETNSDTAKPTNVEVRFDFKRFLSNIKKQLKKRPDAFDPPFDSVNSVDSYEFLPVFNLDPFVKPGVLKVEDIEKPVSINVNWEDINYPNVEQFELKVIAIGTVGRTFRDQISAEQFNTFLRFNGKQVSHFYHSGEMLVQAVEGKSFKIGKTCIGKINNKGLKRAKFLDYGLLLRFKTCIRMSKSNWVEVSGFGTVDPVIKVSSGGSGTP